MRLKQINPGELARRAQQASESVVISQAAKIAARRANPNPSTVTAKPEHGQHIFVLNHLQKNHVVYSLTKVLNNNAALAQLPFNGKKSVPAAIRKDLWHPMAQIKFPEGSGAIGLSTFQKLREYRKRHELEWGDEIYYDPDKEHKGDEERKGGVRSRKDRNKMICDQKANSIADIAAVLNRLAAPGTTVALPEEDGEGEGDLPLQDGAVAKAGEVKAAKGKPLLNIGLVGEGSGTQVEILWRDLHDAEFASTWESNIEHGLLPTTSEEKQRPAQGRLRPEAPAIRRELEADSGTEKREASSKLEKDAATASKQARVEVMPEEKRAEYRGEGLATRQGQEKKRLAREAYIRKQAESKAKWLAMTEEERLERKRVHAARKLARIKAMEESQQLMPSSGAAVLTTGASRVRKRMAREVYIRKQAESKAKWNALTEEQRQAMRNTAAARKKAAVEAQAIKQAEKEAFGGLNEEKR
ncbi:hypothetical protein B2J93_8419 [Marssonina coronariae]|uniref:Large ribosomal subunit protein mL67 n=1 Tax=Diplocarpon coronariae TaxID=2795749 RepID=A0A218Z7S6_9HELO|nr:hypothetical protein B2J93_8419 [Marssonina coronariae]